MNIYQVCIFLHHTKKGEGKELSTLKQLIIYSKIK